MVSLHQNKDLINFINQVKNKKIVVKAHFYMCRTINQKVLYAFYLTTLIINVCKYLLHTWVCVVL